MRTKVQQMRLFTTYIPLLGVLFPFNGIVHGDPGFNIDEPHFWLSALVQVAGCFTLMVYFSCDC
jgi:hypothetical protein